MKHLSLDLFQAATGASDANAALYHEAVLETVGHFQIETEEQVAAFLATIAVESAHLSAVEESLYYKDSVRLAKIYPRKFKTAADAEPYVRNHSALSQLLYNGYHGRGLIQLTWEQNYKIHSRRVGFDYVNDPDLVKQPWHAAMTAGSFWALNGCNDVAGSIELVTERVNGPRKMHLAERTVCFNKALEILA